MAVFLIGGVEAPTSVIGRQCEGVLRLGESFTLYCLETGESRAVRLEVIRIEAYGRDLEVLDAGLTARLTLRGEGVAFLREEGSLVGAERVPSTVA